MNSDSSAISQESIRKGAPPPAQAPDDRPSEFHLFEGDKLLAKVSGRVRLRSDAPKSGEVADVRITYYTDPIRPGESESQAVSLRAAMGRIDMEKKTSTLWGGVDVVMEDGTELSTEEVFADFARNLMRCPKPVLMARYAPPASGDPLDLLAGEPVLILSGHQMEIDRATQAYTISNDGYLWIRGSASDVLDSRKPLSKDPHLQSALLRCDGPMHLRDLSQEIHGPQRIIRVSAQRHVRLERQDGAHRISATADSATVYMAQERGVPGGGSARPLALTMTGDLRLNSSEGILAEAARLDWNYQDDLLRLAGAPAVRVQHGTQRLRAREVFVDRWRKHIAFLGAPSATVRPGNAGGDLTVTARDLEMQCVALQGTWKPEALRATGEVVLSGLLDAAGRRDIVAEGDAFEWNAMQQRGSLRGAPNARVRQGENLVIAPLIVFEGQSLMVVKGPKMLRFVDLKPEERAAAFMDAALGLGGARDLEGRSQWTTTFTATGEADVVYDQEARRVKLVDRCEVRTQDSSLRADVLHVLLSDQGNGGVEQVLGFGGVQILTTAGPGGAARLTGDALEYLPSTRTAKLHGNPHATMTISGRQEINARVIMYNDEKKEFELLDVRTRFAAESP
ncbi:MAG: hypothetical protein HY716_11000 [Planctomycetes bacterium]|nr:hypothetical protein [Planctomycetota bacterium]